MKQIEFDRAVKIIEKSIHGFKDAHGKIEILQIYNTAISQIDLLMELLSIHDRIGLKRLSKLRDLIKQTTYSYELYNEVYKNLEHSELLDIEKALQRLKERGTTNN